MKRDGSYRVDLRPPEHVDGHGGGSKHSSVVGPCFSYLLSQRYQGTKKEPELLLFLLFAMVCILTTVRFSETKQVKRSRKISPGVQTEFVEQVQSSTNNCI